MKQGRSIKYIATFEERLTQEALEFKEATKKQRNGPKPGSCFCDAQAEMGSNIDKWLSSPGLRPPSH
jgi:hypothetical protein